MDTDSSGRTLLVVLHGSRSELAAVSGASLATRSLGLALTMDSVDVSRSGRLVGARSAVRHPVVMRSRSCWSVARGSGNVRVRRRLLEALTRRHRRARAFARHPWWTGAWRGLLYAPTALIALWRESPTLAVAMALVLGATVALLHGLSWGPEGYSRMRYIRRYGAPVDWPEHRWLPEH